MFGAGDDILLTGAYTKNATWYSGLPDMMWGENGQVNGNGQPMYLADAFFNPLTNQWSSPTAWSISALLEHHWTPTFYTNLEASYGQINWSNMGGGCNFYGFGCGVAQAIQGPLSPSASTWLVGADLGWNPVTNLNFDLELMYQARTRARRAGSSARFTTSVAWAARCSCLAIGTATRTASRAASASRATSDRIPIS